MNFQSPRFLHIFQKTALNRILLLFFVLDETAPERILHYSQETCFHVVMTGLESHKMREKTLTLAMMKSIQHQRSLVTYCTIEEVGRLGSNTNLPLNGIKTPTKTILT